MKNINIAKNIADLRKQNGITQEQLASAINISPQAVSKWETGTSVPDTQTLPLIADHFGVSVDYLFYGQNVVYDDIYEKVFQKVASNSQMSKESYEDALKIFAYAHHGISCGNLKGKYPIRDNPIHISDKNGVSILSGKGYGTVITRAFFESINKTTAEFAITLLYALADLNRFLVCMAIVSMSDISFGELNERLRLGDGELRTALDVLIEEKIVIEKESKHKSLGYTYDVNETYHTCLCVLMATLETQRQTLKEFSCCMGYGDYPISFD